MPLQGVNLLMRNVFSAVLLILFALAAPFCSAQENAAPAEVSGAPDGTDPAVSVPDPVPAGISAPAAAPSEWQILGSQWKSVGPDLLHQQKDMWLFPVSLAHGRHWKPALALIGTTALLTAIDVHDAKWVRNNTQPLGGFNNTFAGYNTATATEAFASAFYLVAMARRNAYDQKTFVLAGEAVIDAEILTTIMKDVDGREAPISYPAGGNFTDSWFKVRSGGWLGGLGSMPSGHEIAVMSVATIFAERYPHPAWHRYVAYGLASLVGVSRITLQSHFTSDTFAGGALGYIIARYLVLGHQPSN
jgi:membrane-associated phospholipid phosphatase